LSKDEVTPQHDLFNTKQVDRTIIETYLFFAIELSNNDYSRTALSQIVREINKVFPMPVMILFKHGNTLTLAIINRRLHKRDETKDVLEKVTLIKDISIDKPHRAHVEILFDLSFNELLRVHKFTNFVELHNAWQKTLDTKELNKRFYQELSNWYFWAMRIVYFPGATLEADREGIFQNDDRVREHNAKNLIRLLTRILFVWFIKEKNLIPEELFDESFIRDNLLNNFEPHREGSFVHKSQSSKYYRAILQNLFFATLNQTVGKREFRKSGQHMNVTNLMRYESYFKDAKTFLKLVEETVPFMNGGLFECLDKPALDLKGKKGGDVILYEDGFSDRSDNKLFVPDYIFFGTSEQADLSEEFGKKGKNADVKGLINIFKSYKFTITENTPIEEDIALDPELLGRVFENLLASYNPETKTTARKQTGSFYTPREIVNYMVDESLKAYLKQKLEDESSMTPEDVEIGLEFLIGYNEKEHFFNEKETGILINAIDKCKILDPACGSGAFPMGILHKLVHILHKLDPKNKLWKERQIEKAQTIDDVSIRDKLIEDIETAFASNELDYGRKLYLIENCIYGVDIQPIATQISKLRFFISLIVDQKTDKSKKNFGIRPLPNLETKFVAANTLIGIEKPKTQVSLFDNQDVYQLEDQIKEVRHFLFNAKTPRTKRELREKDKFLREKMGEILTDSGWDNETARQLAGWDPYDQNASSPFFNSEWMFALKDGFDVIIGNPPWGAKLSAAEKDLFKRTYTEIDSSSPNSFAYFLGWAFKNFKCSISFVLPDSILIKDFKKTRILIKNYISEILWYENSGVPEEYKPFVYVDHDVCVINIQKRESDKLHYSLSNYDRKNKFIVEKKFLNNKNEIILEEFDYAFNLIVQKRDHKILKKINQFEKLNNFLQCHEGIHTGNSREILFIRDKKNKYSYPLFYGSGAGDLIDNFLSKTSGWFVDYREELIDKSKGFYASLRDERIFKFPKIYITRTGNPFKAFIDNSTYASNNFFSLQRKNYSENNIDDLKFILPFIISKLAQYFIRTFAAPRLGSTFVETKIFHLLKFRIPVQTKFKHYIITLVDYIITCKQISNNSLFFERLLDSIVYELYLLDEFIPAGCEVLKHLINLPELKDDWSDEKKLKTIEKVYKELSDPAHPVSIAMEKMKNVSEVRIIEGLDEEKMSISEETGGILCRM